MPLCFTSLPRDLSSFSELGSEEEDEEEEDDEDEEEEEEHEEWAVLLLCGFSESLLSDRSEVMSVFSLFRPAFFSSSSTFLRLFTACLAFALESGTEKTNESALMWTAISPHSFFSNVKLELELENWAQRIFSGRFDPIGFLIFS